MLSAHHASSSPLTICENQAHSKEGQSAKHSHESQFKNVSWCPRDKGQIKSQQVRFFYGSDIWLVGSLFTEKPKISLNLCCWYHPVTVNFTTKSIFSIWEFFRFQMTCTLVLYILQNKMKRNYRFPSLPSFIILHSVTVLFIQLVSFHYPAYFYDKLSILNSLVRLLILLVPLWAKFSLQCQNSRKWVFHPSCPQYRWSWSMRQHSTKTSPKPHDDTFWINHEQLQLQRK